VLRLLIKRVTMTEKIVRFGVSIKPDLLKKFDTMIKNEGYLNRSEAIRDLIRKDLIKEKTIDPNLESIGSLTMIYDHHKEILTTTHVHVDHNNCLEILVIKGKTKNIQKLAENIKAIKGIKHGELVITKQNI